MKGQGYVRCWGSHVMCYTVHRHQTTIGEWWWWWGGGGGGGGSQGGSSQCGQYSREGTAAIC